MLFSPSPRELLIALNTAPGLSRPALCRLGLELDRWAGPLGPETVPGPDSIPGSETGARPGPGKMDPAETARGLGLPRATLAKAHALLPEAAAAAAREEEAAARMGARLVTVRDPDYPAALRHLALPPPVLAVLGEIPTGSAVAVVGSRRADAYGLEVAETFSKALAAAGVAVVSGFARGIDAAAHRGALAGPGRTVAVLGCGLGVDYPRGHKRLGQEIAASGAVISELPCGREPRPWHFPVRNRIIAALAAGTLVVQAAPRSGSLSTARHALDLGREVFAVPGPIFDERSLGPNALIRDGAVLVQHPKDILELLVPSAGGAGAPVQPLRAEEEDAPPAEDGLAGVLAPGVTLAPEEIAGRLGQPLDAVLGTLLEWELAGWARRLPGGTYTRGRG